MGKILDLKKTVHDLVREDSQIANIMEELGFVEIVKPGMINTMGRFMTIPKGAAMKGINMDKIKGTFKNKGYEIIE